MSSIPSSPNLPTGTPTKGRRSQPPPSTPATPLNKSRHASPPKKRSKRWYGPRTRAACLEGSDRRRPNIPTRCPKGQKGAIHLQLCYAASCAGRWAGKVRSRFPQNAHTFLLITVLPSRRSVSRVQQFIPLHDQETSSGSDGAARKDREDQSGGNGGSSREFAYYSLSTRK